MGQAQRGAVLGAWQRDHSANVVCLNRPGRRGPHGQAEIVSVVRLYTGNVRMSSVAAGLDQHSRQNDPQSAERTPS